MRGYNGRTLQRVGRLLVGIEDMESVDWPCGRSTHIRSACPADRLRICRLGFVLVDQQEAFKSHFVASVFDSPISLIRRCPIDIEIALHEPASSRSEEHTSELQSPCNL